MNRRQQKSRGFAHTLRNRGLLFLPIEFFERFLYELFVKIKGLLFNSYFIHKIGIYQPEPPGVPARPFKIIHQRPDVIPEHRQALFLRTQRPRRITADIVRTRIVENISVRIHPIGQRYPVFGDRHRQGLAFAHKLDRIVYRGSRSLDVPSHIAVYRVLVGYADFRFSVFARLHRFADVYVQP